MFLGAAELSQDEKGVIEQFKDKAREFWALWENLEDQKHTISASAPIVQNEYADLMARGSTIRTTVEYVTKTIDKAAQMYRSVRDWLAARFGLDGLSASDVDQRVNEMGLIPLIPIAIITAALAAMGKWISDAYIFSERLAEIKRLEKQGISPARAAEIVEKTMQKGMFAGAANLVPIALIGVAALMLLRK